jgi:hypothetical protein
MAVAEGDILVVGVKVISEILMGKYKPLILFLHFLVINFMLLFYFYIFIYLLLL